MPSGNIKLEVKGNVDYLTEFPQVSFFNVLYKRHTNYASESIYLPMDGALEFGEIISCILPRSGDLIHKQCLAITLSEVSIPRLTPFSGLDRTVAQSNYASFLSFLNLLYPVYRNQHK